jgi:tetratricopeptide (TPR) repeat protein
MSAKAHAYLAAALGGRSHYESVPGLLSRAEREIQESLRLDPDSPDAHRILASVTTQRGRIGEALEEYLRAVELGGPEERVAIMIARTYANLGRPDRAISWTQLAKHWESRRGEADSALGDYWTDLCMDSEAEKAYRRGAELHPELPAAWLALCRLYLLQGEFDKANALFFEHCREFSSFTEQKQMLAQIEFFSRRFAEAEQIYADLASKDDNGGGDYYGGISYQSALGWLWLSQGDKGKAQLMLESCLAAEKAINSDAPNNPTVLYRIAAIESSLGNQEAALTYLDAAVENGWLDFRSASLDPRFDGCSSDPRFKTILARVSEQVATLRQQIGTAEKKHL